MSDMSAGPASVPESRTCWDSHQTSDFLERWRIELRAEVGSTSVLLSTGGLYIRSRRIRQMRGDRVYRLDIQVRPADTTKSVSLGCVGVHDLCRKWHPPIAYMRPCPRSSWQPQKTFLLVQSTVFGEFRAQIGWFVRSVTHAVPSPAGLWPALLSLDGSGNERGRFRQRRREKSPHKLIPVHISSGQENATVRGRRPWNRRLSQERLLVLRFC